MPKKNSKKVADSKRNYYCNDCGHRQRHWTWQVKKQVNRVRCEACGGPMVKRKEMADPSIAE